MIFVTLGTITYPFDRLASIINRLSSTFSGQIIVQSGHTHTFNSNKSLYIQPFMPTHQIRQYISQSQLVISHGGEGSLFDILEYSLYIPIIFPRSQKFGEHVDEYQRQIAAVAQKRGWAWVGNNPQQISRLISQHLKLRPKLTLDRTIFRQNHNLINFLIKKFPPST